MGSVGGGYELGHPAGVLKTGEDGGLGTVSPGGAEK